MTLWIGWRLYSNRHNLPCPAWLSWMVELDNPFAKAHKAKEIIQTLPLQDGVRILDIGCGPGRVLLPLAEKVQGKGGHVTGLDIQASMIEKAKLKAQQLNITNVDFINSNIIDAKINEPYDIITMVCVLGEIPQRERTSVMQKLVSHLRPEGVISITETMFDPHYQRRNEVSKMMKAIGFGEMKFTGNTLAYSVIYYKNEKNNKRE